jgi:hypothetical protein
MGSGGQPSEGSQAVVVGEQRAAGTSSSRKLESQRKNKLAATRADAQDLDGWMDEY